MPTICLYLPKIIAMRFKVKVNTDNLAVKLRKNVNIYVKQMIIDGADYLARKIREEVISGQIVGVRTGNLRAGTQAEEQDDKVVVVSEMDYTQHVLEWSKAKYGQSYFELANQLYGGNIAKIIQEEAKKVYQNNYKYVNPFP